MSGYPAHPLAKVGDKKSDETSFYTPVNRGDYPSMPFPNFPSNPEPPTQGIGFNNPNVGYPGQGDLNFPGQPNQSNYPPDQPAYPNLPGYPSHLDYPNQPPPAYPAFEGQQPGYPNQPVYPGQQLGYPGQQLGYPGQQPGYPGQQPGYSSQQPGYQGQQPVYPSQHPVYPSQQPGFPGQQPGFPGFDPRGFVPLKPMDGKGNNDGDATNTMLSISDGGEAGGIDIGNSFSDKKIRHAFVKKVYLILSVQLLCTLGFVAVFVLNNDVKKWVRRNTVFYWTSYGVFLVTYFMLACPCCMGIRRRWPWNFICLTLFTLAMSYMTGTISCFYQTEIVIIALAVTTGVCIAISIFAIQTKVDFTMCHGVLFVFSIVFFLFGIACIIVYKVWGPNYILQVVYGSIGALMFSLFLLVDTQTIIGGKNRKHQISPEEYIFGALQLYLDIVNLFLMLLKVIGAKKN